MGLSDRLKWKLLIKNNKDRSKKLTTISYELDDQKLLVDIAKNDSDHLVRERAIRKINDESVLIDIAKNHSNYWTRSHAVNEINDESILADIAKNDSNNVVCEEAIRKINDESVLADIATKTMNNMVNDYALSRIEDKSLLEDLVENCPNKYVRYGAFRKLKPNLDPDNIDFSRVNDEFLIEYYLIACTSLKYENRLKAVKNPNLKDREVLIKLAIHDTDPEIRLAATNKIQDYNTLKYIAENDPHKEGFFDLEGGNQTYPVRRAAERRLRELHQE